MPAARNALLLAVAPVCVPWKNRSVIGSREGKYFATVSASLKLTPFTSNVPSRSIERARSTRPTRSACR